MNVDKMHLDNLNLPVPLLFLKGEVDVEMYELSFRAFAYLRSKGSPAMEIHLDSCGGSVTKGLDIYDLIRLYPGKTTATVFGLASSMGAIILQACDVRRAARHSSMNIHTIRKNDIPHEVLLDTAKLKESLKGFDALQRCCTRILALRTKKPSREIYSVCSEYRHMDAKEALAFGLIDKIV